MRFFVKNLSAFTYFHLALGYYFVEDFRMTLKSLQCFPHDLDQSLFCRFLKHKTIAVGFFISVILHGILQSSHFTDDRQGPVTQTVDLIQPAGLIQDLAEAGWAGWAAFGPKTAS